VLLAGQPATMLPDVPLTGLPPLDVPMPLSLQVAQLAPDAEAQVGHRWSAHPAPVPRIDPLPPVALRPAGPCRTLGVGSAGPVPVDFDVTDRHLLVVGDAGSGRSTVLAGVGHLLTDADAWLVDPRRSLEDAGIRALRAAHTPAEIETLLADLHRELLSTLDAGRRARRTLLLIDDQDVAAALTSPTTWSAIAALLPLAADLRLTVAVARRCAGMARLAYDPFLAAIREAGATGLLLDGSPDEGPIVAGVRCRPGPVGRALLVRPGQPPRPLQLYADLAEPERHVSNL
jgi:S-DNA-T family DNA segregation ATPase FtsK/SpoIIIE